MVKLVARAHLLRAQERILIKVYLEGEEWLVVVLEGRVAQLQEKRTSVLGETLGAKS
jgi:3-dehydroquinate synthase class II